MIFLINSFNLLTINLLRTLYMVLQREISLNRWTQVGFGTVGIMYISFFVQFLNIHRVVPHLDNVFVYDVPDNRP